MLWATESVGTRPSVLRSSGTARCPASMRSATELRLAALARRARPRRSPRAGCPPGTSAARSARRPSARRSRGSRRRGVQSDTWSSEVATAEARQRHVRRRAAATLGRVVLVRVNSAAGLRPTICSMIQATSMSASVGAGHDAAVAQHRDRVADLQQLVELVRDVDDRDARAPAGRAMTRKSPSTSAALSADVGSSMIRTRTSWASALAISTTCCWPMRRSLTSVVGVDRPAPAADDSRARCRSALRSIDAADATQLRGQEDVVGDAEVGAQVELLVDDADPVAAGLERRVQVNRLRRRGAFGRESAARRRPGSSSASTCPPRSRRRGR